MGTRKNDMILIAALIAAALIGFFIMKAGRKDSGLNVQITRDGEAVLDQSLDGLDLPFTYEVRSGDDGVNVFVIDRTEDGSIGVSCTRADCPDKICVGTGTITLSDELIVCLPHKIVARLYAPE